MRFQSPRISFYWNSLFRGQSLWILYSMYSLRKLYSTKKFNYEQHPTTNKLTWGIEHVFFEEHEESQYALVHLQALRSVSVTEEPQTRNPAPIFTIIMEHWRKQRKKIIAQYILTVLKTWSLCRKMRRGHPSLLQQVRWSFSKLLL